LPIINNLNNTCKRPDIENYKKKVAKSFEAQERVLKHCFDLEI